MEFRDHIGERLKMARVRCVEFDDEGCAYLNRIDRSSIVKMSANWEIEWEVLSKVWTSRDDTANALGLGSFQFIANSLLVSDFYRQKIVLINKKGRVKYSCNLPMKAPLFAQYIPHKKEYHVSDEQTGAIFIFNHKLKKRGEYRSPDDLLRPVQILYLQKKEAMLVASSFPQIKTSLEWFDLDGNYQGDLATFSRAPCHVAKITHDGDHIFAADSFGRIYKVDFEGNIIWRHSESQIRERFKYIKYHRSYLYLSDNYRLRRFKI